MAGGLAARGVKPGDRILLHAENCPEALLTWFAAAWMGAVCVSTNPRSAGPELGYFASHTGVVGAVTQAEFADLLSRHCPELKWIAVTNADGTDRPDRASSFAALRGEPAARCEPDAAAASNMLFTSGTTSRPKAVVWTHANALWAARLGAQQLGLREDDVCQVFLPLYHVVGLAWSVLPALWSGAQIVLQPRFSATRFWPTALEHRATFASHVQFSSGVLARQPVPAAHSFRLWGNSTWLPELEEHFRVPILGWWGMTEVVAPGIAGDRALPQRPRSIGRPSLGYRLRIIDEAERSVSPGEAGELLIQGERGVSLFSEYFGDPEATAEAFDEQGFFHTGDRMMLNEDGSVEFVERTKDVIKVGGEGVSAAEVERVIREVVGVAEAAVVSRPDAVYGEVCVAFVVAADRQEEKLSAEILERCRAELAPFKVPRELRFVATLPRAGLEKIAKGELRRLALNAPAAVPNSHA